MLTQRQACQQLLACRLPCHRLALLLLLLLLWGCYLLQTLGKSRQRECWAWAGAVGACQRRARWPWSLALLTKGWRGGWAPAHQMPWPTWSPACTPAPLLVQTPAPAQIHRFTLPLHGFLHRKLWKHMMHGFSLIKAGMQAPWQGLDHAGVWALQSTSVWKSQHACMECRCREPGRSMPPACPTADWQHTEPPSVRTPTWGWLAGGSLRFGGALLQLAGGCAL